MPSYSSGNKWFGHGGSSAAPAARAALSNMSRYNVRGGVCFTGDCLVTLADGKQARMDSLRRGTALLTAKGPAEVSAIVKTKISGQTDLCKIGNMKVTPWHPINYDGVWKFPSDIVAPTKEACEAVYSVLLLPSPYVDAHSMFIDGVKVVTLGHGLIEKPEEGRDVRNHEFFGNYAKVFDGLRELKGFYEDGVCECEGIVRDMETGLIKGFIAPLEQDSLVDAFVSQTVTVGA